MSERLQEIKQLYFRAKFYRIMALLLGITGVFVLAYQYNKLAHGNLFNALSDPYFVVIILVPFIPAAFLSWLATRLEKKTVTMYKDPENKTR